MLISLWHPYRSRKVPKDSPANADSLSHLNTRQGPKNLIQFLRKAVSKDTSSLNSTMLRIVKRVASSTATKTVTSEKNAKSQ